jgi:hypothetical protein
MGSDEKLCKIKNRQIMHWMRDRPILPAMIMLKNYMMTAPQHSTPMARSALTMMVVTLVIAVFSMAASAWFFTGFLGGGRSVVGLFQAFLLCFGIGAIAYGPALAIFWMARHVRGNGPKRWVGGLTAALALPVWGYGIAALIFKLPYSVWAVVAILIGLYLTFWAIVVFRHGN